MITARLVTLFAVAISTLCGAPALAAPPQPGDLLGQWTFEPGSELVDLTGHFGPLTLRGNATVANGRLNVNAVTNGGAADATGWANTQTYSGPTIREKTLVSWVSLENLSVRSGSAMTIDNLDIDNFDAIVYGERVPLRWMAGSTSFLRTQDAVTADETAVNQVIQMAIAYQDLGSGQVRITICRNGVQIGQYTSGNMTQWTSGNTEVLFGARHTWSGVNTNGGIDAQIEEARLYQVALTCGEAGALQPAGPAPAAVPVLTGLQCMLLAAVLYLFSAHRSGQKA